MDFETAFRRPLWMTPGFDRGLCCIEDPTDKGAGGGGGGKGSDDSAKQAEATKKAEAEAAAKLAAVEKTNAEMAAKIKASEEAEAKKRADAEEAKKKKALDEGKAKELLTAAEEKLKAADAERGRLIKMLTERGDAQLERLPEPDRKRLSAYKDRVPPDVWLSMIDDEVNRLPAPAGSPSPPTPAPPAPGGTPPAANPAQGYKPSAVAVEFLGSILQPQAVNRLKRAVVSRPHDEDGRPIPGARRKFSLPIANFFGDMNRGRFNPFEQPDKDAEK